METEDGFKYNERSNGGQTCALERKLAQVEGNYGSSSGATRRGRGRPVWCNTLQVKRQWSLAAEGLKRSRARIAGCHSVFATMPLMDMDGVRFASEIPPVEIGPSTLWPPNFIPATRGLNSTYNCRTRSG